MTFDFTPEQQALATRAREAAAAIGDSVAHAIDTLGAVADDVSKSLKAQALTTFFRDSAVKAAIVVEELAAVSAGLGASVGFKDAVGVSPRTVVPMMLAGLRGSEMPLAAATVGDSITKMRARLVAAAVALGVGRAAVVHSVAAMKKASVKPGPDTTVPHWALADGATDVEAARLLTYCAAQMLDRGEDADEAIAGAHIFAAKAAANAVDAAIRVEGAAGYSRGGQLERLARDARTLQVILKT